MIVFLFCLLTSLTVVIIGVCLSVKMNKYTPHPKIEVQTQSELDELDHSRYGFDQDYMECEV